MGFPSDDSLPLTPAEGFEKSRTVSGRIKRKCTTAVSAVANDSKTVEIVWQIHDDLVEAKTELTDIAAIDGIEDFARDQVQDQDRDISGEFTTMLSAIGSAITAIEGGFPQDESGYLLERTQEAGTSNRPYRLMSTLSPASRTGLQSVLQAVINTID